MRSNVRTLEQLKLDAKRKHGWPWKIYHPNDERALLNGCYPNYETATRVREFYEDMLYIPHEGGGTQPFVLLDWWFEQILGPLFGWKRADGRRSRFDKAFITTAKKSGKSTVLAGLPLYMMIADGEEEAECYAAAVDRDQASIIYKKTSRAVKLSPELSGILTRVDSQKRIVYEASGSYFEAISSDADSAEGKNPHLLLADEVHVWRKREFFNALMYGDIQRSQPLFLMITTAGDDAAGIGFEEYEFARDLLNPNNDFYSESHFAFIAEAKPDREWDDPIGWKEANPSLDLPGFGRTEKLIAKCDEVKKTPRKQREFIRYICNRWQTGLEDAWINQDQWAACGKLPQVIADGDTAHGGLDLSRRVDLTSFCLAFRHGEYFDFKWWFWIPADNIKERENRDRVPYRDWVAAGWIETTPGSSVDYAYVRRRISGVTLDESGQPSPELDDSRLVAQYNISSIGFDPWNASKLVTELKDYDQIEMLEFGQGYRSMNQPCKEFEALLADGRIRHGNNPVVNWMTGHCIADTDPAGNVKLTKKKSRHKIDGIVTAVMALGIAVSAPENVEAGIFY